MKITAILFSKLMVIVLIASFATSCANIIPPDGGPRDSLPPNMVMAFPKDSSTSFNSKKITLTFDEYVEAREMQQNLLVNPLPVNLPVVDYKLRNVFVTLKDSLEPNTTYTINFGNAIKDVNEGNIAKNQTYVFSTGKTIDHYSVTGKVIQAKDGKPDSTLTVVLHPNLSDTAVVKLRPRYLAKLDGAGRFRFTNLPKATYNIFVLPNDFSKKYDDTTKLFAFLNEPINTADSLASYTLYAYRQAEPAPPAAPQSTEGKDKGDKKLKYATSLVNNRYDVLDSSIQIVFNRKVVLKNSKAIQLLDSSFKPVNETVMQFDSTGTQLTIKAKTSLETKYYLLLSKDDVADTTGLTLFKSDTIKFSSYGANDYGSIKIRCNQPSKNAVLQVLKDGKIQNTFAIVAREIKQDLFKPGEYELRVLIDENNNGVWDTGNYKQKKQPEKVMPVKNKLLVKAKWDNEMDLSW